MQLIKSMKQALMKQTAEAVKHCSKPLAAPSTKKKKGQNPCEDRRESPRRQLLEPNPATSSAGKHMN